MPLAVSTHAIERYAQRALGWPEEHTLPKDDKERLRCVILSLVGHHDHDRIVAHGRHAFVVQEGVVISFVPRNRGQRWSQRSRR